MTNEEKQRRLHAAELTRLRAVLGSDAEVYRTLQHQFGVLFQRTQSVFTLGGLTITVTGFSGHRIMAAGLASGLPVLIGLALALLALGLALYGISRIRFLSRHEGRDSEESFLLAMAVRDRKTRLFTWSLAFLILGLAFYVMGVSVYLFAAAGGRLPLD